MREWKVGDIVMIRRNSEYYQGTPSNPINKAGTITIIDEYSSIFDDLIYTVKWGYDDNKNDYKYSDLMYAKPLLMIERLKNRRNKKQRRWESLRLGML